MKINKETLLNIYLLLSIAFIYTNSIYNIRTPIIISLSIILIFSQLVSKRKSELNVRSVGFVFYLFSLLISTFISPRITESFNFLIPFTFITIDLIIISKEKIKVDNLTKYIVIFSSIHVICTLFYQLFPSIMQKILPYLLNSSDLNRNLYEFNHNKINCGICPIQSANAFYISTFIMVFFTDLITRKEKKYVNIIMLIIGFITLFLTTKRGFLISNIIAMIFIIFYKLLKNKKINVNKCIKFIVLLVITLIIGNKIITLFFPNAYGIFYRFQQKDITTGRMNLYKVVFDNFMSGNKLIGSGLFSSRTTLLNTLGNASDAHNIYLQILAELGLLGTFSFLVTLITIYISIKRINYQKYDEKTILTPIYFIILFIVYGITGNGLFDLMIVYMYYIFVGIILYLSKNSKEEDI